MIEIRVHENIFKEYPAFRRGIVVANKIKNRGHSEELKAMLNQAVAEAAKQPIDLKLIPEPLRVIKPTDNLVLTRINIRPHIVPS